MSDVSITFDGQFTELKNSLDGIQDYIKGWGDKIKGIGALAFGAFGIKELIGFGKDFVNQASEAAQIDAKLASVIQATGGAAGFTAEQMGKLADNIKDVTTFDDDAIKGAEALLATFSEIRGDEFERTTKLAADMATVLGGDVTAAAGELGKALNNPLRGMQLLQRQGITLSDSQQQLITRLVQTGDTAKAQDILLDALQKRYGGAAEAAANAAGGGWKQLQNMIGDVEKAIGGGLLSVLDVLVPYLKSGAELVGDWAEAFKSEFGPAISNVVSNDLAALSAGWDKLKDVGAGVVDYLTGLWSEYGDRVTYVVDSVKEIWDEQWATLKAVGSAALDGIGALWSGLTAYITPVVDVGFSYVAKGFDFLKTTAIEFFTAAQVLWKNFPEVAQFAWDSAQLGAVTFFEDMKFFFTDTAPTLIKWFGDNWREVFTDIWDYTKTIVVNLTTNLKDFFTAITSWLHGDGFDFKFTGLTEGFESSIKELPQLAERHLSDLEKSLGAKTAEQGKKLAESFSDQYQKNLDIFSGKVKPPQLEGAPAVAAAAAAGDGGKKTDANKPREAPARDQIGEGFKAQFEDASALFKRIQGSAASDPAEKQLTTLKEQRDIAKQEQAQMIDYRREHLAWLRANNKLTAATQGTYA